MISLFVVSASQGTPKQYKDTKLVRVHVDATGKPTRTGVAELMEASGSHTFKSVNVENALRHAGELRRLILDTIL